MYIPKKNVFFAKTSLKIGLIGPPNKLLEQQIREKLFKGKAIILTGPRQTGKTTLLKSIFGRMLNSYPEFFNNLASLLTENAT